MKNLSRAEFWKISELINKRSGVPKTSHTPITLNKYNNSQGVFHESYTLKVPTIFFECAANSDQKNDTK